MGEDDEIIQTEDVEDLGEWAEAVGFKHKCDNLFMTNYFYKGGEKFEFPEFAAETRIKEDIIETFIDFFGEEYSDQIKERVDKFKIYFQYKICGERNSVEAFLEEKRSEYVKTKTGYDYIASYSNDVSILAHELYSNCGGDFDRFVNEQKDDAVFKSAFDFFGDGNVDYNNIDEMKNVFNKMRYYQSCCYKYSDIPEVEADMQEIENVVIEYRKEAQEYLKSEGRDSSERALKKFFAKEVFDWDPIAQLTTKKCSMDHDLPEQKRYVLLNDYGFTSAQTINTTFIDQNRLESGIRFGGVHCCDRTIIHEFVHAITKSGFRKGLWGVKPSPKDAIYSSESDISYMLDEVITDYLAIKMVDLRKAKGKDLLVNGRPYNSSYSDLFPYVEKFLDECLPVIKKTMMSDNSFADLVSVVGEDALNKISITLNELNMLLRGKNCEDIANKAREMGLNVSPSAIYYVTRNYEKISDEEKKTYAQIEAAVADSPHLQDFMRMSREMPELVAAATQNVQKNMENDSSTINNGPQVIQAPEQSIPTQQAPVLQTAVAPPRGRDDDMCM